MQPGASANVLMIHGAGGGGWEWRAWGRAFRAAGFGVLAPDLQPAEGGLPATRLDDYRRQAVGWARDASVIVGASLGGWLALAVSAEARPRSRILVNPVPPDGTRGWPPARREFASVIPWGSDRDFEGTRRALPDGDWHAHRLAFDNWRDESGRVMAALYEGAVVESFNAPTLVLASEDDDDVPVETSRALAASIGADFVQVRGASHLGPLLGRSAVYAAELALEWLQGLESPGSR